MSDYGRYLDQLSSGQIVTPVEFDLSDRVYCQDALSFFVWIMDSFFQVSDAETNVMYAQHKDVVSKVIDESKNEYERRSKIIQEQYSQSYHCDAPRADNGLCNHIYNSEYPCFLHIWFKWQEALTEKLTRIVVMANPKAIELHLRSRSDTSYSAPQSATQPHTQTGEASKSLSEFLANLGEE